MKPQQYIRILAYVLFIVFALAGCKSKTSPTKTTNTDPGFIKLPASCTTPDGMAIAPDGNLLLTCPNYADQSVKACILKIDKAYNVSLFYEFPAYEPTGVVCPMGIDSDRNGDI